MKKILILLMFSLILVGCNSTSSKSYKEIMKENEYIIVDVRTKEEYNEAHLVNAINIPYDEIDENSNLDKEKIIFVYCRSGARSSVAYATLVSLGYTVYDLGAFDKIDLPKE